ncbi:hypothetical protein AB0D42_05590 [Streptomyces sp. NPDC048304]|jgi:hypothetical protein|uniref:hypothetical protein n=1 Tax=unclassified Streptomyces TaxID=2593676 RepID=UPI003407EBEE
MSGPRPDPEPRPAPDTVSDVIRWAAFSCALVPVVLLWYGTSPAGAAGAALGLAAVTAACRLLLRRSERCARRHGCDGEVSAEDSGAQRGGRHTRRPTPVD